MNLEFMETMHFFDTYLNKLCLQKIFGYESKNFNFLLIVSQREEQDGDSELNK